MTQARAAMHQNMEIAAELGPEGAKVRRWRFWRGAGAVMETIAKWAFLAELVLLWMQFNAAEEQRAELRKCVFLVVVELVLSMED